MSEAYTTPITTALMLFPFLALAVSIPFLIHYYRKYGAITFIRGLLFYSFVFYCLCAYFLVILPLPSRTYVAGLTTQWVQLEPFQFFRDFYESGFVLSRPSTWLAAFESSFSMQYAYNILLLLPMGVYLRYYFKKSFGQTVFICFCVSLFFELTQLSGLYGFYSRPYRLFDVDDLICNTTGGALGWAFEGLFSAFLPTMAEIDSREKLLGKRVPLLRRMLAYGIDLLIVGGALFLTASLTGWTGLLSASSLLVCLFCYFTLFTWLTHGSTPGKRMMRFRVVTRSGQAPGLGRLLLRNGVLYGSLYIWFDLVRLCLADIRAGSALTDSVYFYVLAVLLIGAVLLFIVDSALNAKKRGRDYLYGNLSGTMVESTISHK